MIRSVKTPTGLWQTSRPSTQIQSQRLGLFCRYFCELPEKTEATDPRADSKGRNPFDLSPDQARTARP